MVNALKRKILSRVIRAVSLIFILLACLLSGVGYLVGQMVTTKITGAEVLSGCSNSEEHDHFKDLIFEYRNYSNEAVYRGPLSNLNFLRFMALTVNLEGFDLDGKAVMEMKDCDRHVKVKYYDEELVVITIIFEEGYTPNPS